MMDTRILVIAAHIGDFVWRCGGTIAKYVKAGAEVDLIVMTYGTRGECNAYWKANPDGTAEECGQIRDSEGRKAAEILGISHMEVLDLEDYPINMTRERTELLAEMIRKYRPQIILTHDSEIDPYNTDHSMLGRAVYEASAIASAAGAYLNGYQPHPRPKVYGFEPHIPEDSSFSPEIYIDISEVQPVKEAAMNAYGSQKNMFPMYVNRARMRAQQSGIAGCTYAECFTMKHFLSEHDYLTR